MSRPPIHTFRMGFIKADIWRNDTKVGLRHTVSVVRLYRDGDIWRESTRFGRDDLPLVSKVSEFALEWIYFHSKDIPEGVSHD